MAIVGIDLGTTNSLIGRIEKGRPRLFQSESGSTLIPSVVSFSSDQSSPLVGAEAKAQRLQFPEQTIYSAKRFIGCGLTDVSHWMKILPFDFSASDSHIVRFRIGNKAYTPSEISAHVLAKLKTLAETQTGEKVDKAVVTVPAYFNDAQRQATKLAGELAGLEIVRIVNEPTAACLAYGLDKKTMGTVAVFDLGGGTFDISLLRVKEGVFEVLATNGDTALGGDDFDHALIDALTTEITQTWGSGWLSAPAAKAALISQAEEVKKALSDTDVASFQVSWEGKTFSKQVYRTEFESWIQPIIDKLKRPCIACVKDARLKVEQITDVILVGGSTRVPAVRQMVTELFGREPICTLNPDEVVAMGAAVQANILSGQMGEMLLLDVIPLSLGIDTMGGVVSKIIHRNSTIPISASQTFTTYVDGQTSVDIHVLQGERELSQDNRSLARFQLKGIPPLPAGIPKIEVEFIVDANGILNVRALELRTGTKASVTVNPSYGLSDSHVEKMLEEAYENAERDFHLRFLLEARTEADSLLRATRKSLEKGHALISEEEVETIHQSTKALELLLSGSDTASIKRGIEQLNQATQKLAENLLNAAVRETLTNQTLAGNRNEMD
jgi:molecular chaperone DnaK